MSMDVIFNCQGGLNFRGWMSTSIKYKVAIVCSNRHTKKKQLDPFKCSATIHQHYTQTDTHISHRISQAVTTVG